MIREKDIGKYRFYTTDGTDMWRVKKVSTFTLVELVNCETGGTASARVGEGSAGGFTAVKMPKIKKTGKRGRVSGTSGKKRGRKKRKTPVGGSGQSNLASLRKSGKGVRKGKSPTSKYRGVCIDKRAKLKRFRAQIIRDGKYTNLGAYAVEEKAAAAVADFLGDKKEAERLRAIADKRDQAKADETLHRDKWMCHGCGASYDTRPRQCTHCGSGAFEKSRPADNHK